ncbi:MAG: cell division protein FtsA [Clostridiaceae bacterium]|nr:cell division protein FtsA [Clostridiaceae bacterium]
MPVQDRATIFALDIGTRSIVGVLGREEGGRFRVLDIEKEPHGRRAMLDGQIEDIAQVAAVAKTVVERLEARQHIRLQRVCVAAAGRALRSARASFTMEFAEPRQADDELVNQLESGAVSAAEGAVSGGGEGGFYMVGYTASQYRLDGYPLSTLHGHRGRVMEVDVVATFLPREVVDSLYTVVARTGLEVSSLTLEPIASLNAAIPVDIRLLNLVLVDIGAGTSDIAVCRSGSVAGYTMATVAGDEVTELLMKQLLVDFQTGEALKMGIGGQGPLHYTDILGIAHECTSEQLIELTAPAVKVLAEEIADKVIELNGGPPSAAFLAGGGSKLYGLRAAVAQALGMDDMRVAIAGNHFEKNAFSDEYALNDPEYSTPLGIAVSAALGMINDSYVVTLNGAPAKLFRSGTLTIRDVLLMNGSNYGELMGRTGSNLSFTLNGERQFFRGTPGTPPIIRLNGEEAELGAVVHAGDSVVFVPAKAGVNASRTLAEALGESFPGSVFVNGEPKPLGYALHTGDVVIADGTPQPQQARRPVRPAEVGEPAPAAPAAPVRSHATVLSSGSGGPAPQRAGRELAGRLAFGSAAPVLQTVGENASPAAPVVPPVEEKTVPAAPAVLAAEEKPAPAAPAVQPVEEKPVPLVPADPPAKAKPAPTVPAVEKPAPTAPERVSEPAVESAPVEEPAEKIAAPRAAVPVRDPNAPKRRGVPRVILPDLPVFAAAQKTAGSQGLSIRLNGSPLSLPPKDNGDPYYFMDILQHSGLDFDHLRGPVELLLNGAPCDFTRTLAENDEVVIRCKE